MVINSVQEIKKFVIKKSFFFSDIKRVYYIMITVGKVSSHENFAKCRSSCPELLDKVGVLKDFAKFTGKHQCRSLLMKM